MGWLKQSISDSDGCADMAYLVIGLLALSAVFALVFIFTMSAISFRECVPTLTISNAVGDGAGQDTRHIVPCVFDPLPVGQAAGLIFGAFGALIGALAGYMAATRKQPKSG